MSQLTKIQYKYTDTSDQHLAQGLMKMAWGTAIGALIGLILQFLDKTNNPWFHVFNYPLGKNQLAYLMICVITLVGLVLVMLFINQGKLYRASIVFVISLFGLAIFAYVPNQLTSSIMLVFSLPVTAAGVLLSRRGLAISIAFTVLLLIALYVLYDAGFLDNIATGTPTVVEAIGYGIIILIVDGIILNVFAGGQRRLLQENLAITHELETAIEIAREANEEQERLLEEQELSNIERERLQQEVIEAQQRAIKELSTPVIPIMDQVIVMPLVGSIDTLRARDVTRALLAGISEHQAKVVIVDITGVTVVDTGVVNYLNKTIQAARLKGARTIVTGISDAVAETIVDLGIDWRNIETLRDLQTGLVVALKSKDIQLGQV
jgi:anti-anti-sigma regulatory factor